VLNAPLAPLNSSALCAISCYMFQLTRSDYGTVRSSATDELARLQHRIGAWGAIGACMQAYAANALVVWRYRIAHLARCGVLQERGWKGLGVWSVGAPGLC
jgi:hypothetical protein